MVDFSLERPGDHNYVRSAGDNGIRVGEQFHTEPLLLAPDEIVTDWPPRTLSELRITHLEALFALRPEVALLGTGPAHAMLPRELLVELYRRSFVLEVMSTHAACRTFNVLVADDRRVVAGLLPL